MKSKNSVSSVKVPNLSIIETEFPLYMKGQFNLAAEYSQAVRKGRIGYLNGMFQDFCKGRNQKAITISNWIRYYNKQKPNGIKTAVKTISDQLIKHGNAVYGITSLPKETMSYLKMWVEDLVYNKSFNGFLIQEATLANVAKHTKSKMRRATETEDSHGIDGFINNKSTSIKPSSFYIGSGRTIGDANKKIAYVVSADTEKTVTISMI